MSTTHTTSHAPAGAAPWTIPAPTAPLSPRLNRRDEAAMARLLAILAEGVALHDAVWAASEHGMTLDTARLVDLFNEHAAWVARRLDALLPRASAALMRGDARTYKGCLAAARRLASDDALADHLSALLDRKNATAAEERP